MSDATLLEVPSPNPSASWFEVSCYTKKVPSLRNIIGQRLAQSIPLMFAEKRNEFKMFMSGLKDDVAHAIGIFLTGDYLFDYIMIKAGGNLSVLEKQLDERNRLNTTSDDFMRVCLTLRDNPMLTQKCIDQYFRMMWTSYISFKMYSANSRPEMIYEIGMGHRMTLLVDPDGDETVRGYFMRHNYLDNSISTSNLLSNQPVFSRDLASLLVPISKLSLKLNYCQKSSFKTAHELKSTVTLYSSLAGKRMSTLSSARERYDMVCRRLYWTDRMIRMGRLAEALGHLLSCWKPENDHQRVDFFAYLIDLSSQLFLDISNQCIIINWAFQDIQKSSNGVLQLQARQYRLIPSVIKAMGIWGMYNLAKSTFQLAADPSSNSMHRAEALMNLMRVLGEDIENQVLYVQLYRKFHRHCFEDSARVCENNANLSCRLNQNCHVRMKSIKSLLARFRMMHQQLALTRVPNAYKEVYLGLLYMYESMYFLIEGETRKSLSLQNLAMSHLEFGIEKFTDCRLYENLNASALKAGLVAISDDLDDFEPELFLEYNVLVNQESTHFPMARTLFTGCVLASLHLIDCAKIAEWCNEALMFYENSSDKRSHRERILRKSMAIYGTRRKSHELEVNRAAGENNNNNNETGIFFRRPYLSTNLCFAEKSTQDKIVKNLLPCTDKMKDVLMPMVANEQFVPEIPTFDSVRACREAQSVRLCAPSTLADLTLAGYANMDGELVGKWLFFGLHQLIESTK